MTPHEARDRRVFRLTWLLLGTDADLAAAATARVLSSGRDLSKLDPARLDRHCVQAARHVAPKSSTVPSTAGAEPLRAAAALPRQCLEAWVLTRVEGLDAV